jgi:hypothetical protein
VGRSVAYSGFHQEMDLLPSLCIQERAASSDGSRNPDRFSSGDGVCYGIVAHRDLADAAFKMEEYFGKMQDSAGTLAGTPEAAQPAKQGAICGEPATKLLN